MIIYHRLENIMIRLKYGFQLSTGFLMNIFMITIIIYDNKSNNNNLQ